MVTTLILLVLFVIAVKLFGRAEKELPSRPPLNYDVEPDNDWEVEYFNAKNSYGGIEEPFRTYFQLSDKIKKSKDINAKIVACEESYKILPDFVRAYLQDSGRLPDTILCRDVGVDLYMRQGEWTKARSAIEKCAAAGVYDDDGQEMYDYLERYQTAATIALQFLRDNPGYLQKNIYKALPSVDRECLKKFTRSSLLIRKEPQGNSNRLYIVE